MVQGKTRDLKFNQGNDHWGKYVRTMAFPMLGSRKPFSNGSRVLAHHPKFSIHARHHGKKFNETPNIGPAAFKFEGLQPFSWLFFHRSPLHHLKHHHFSAAYVSNFKITASNGHCKVSCFNGELWKEEGAFWFRVGHRKNQKAVNGEEGRQEDT